MPTAFINREIAEIVRRIVEVAAPERIVLFGSAARGDDDLDSDLDFLVIKAGVHRRKLAQKIYRNLLGVSRAVDIVVVTPDDVKEHGKTPGYVTYEALAEGRVVYAA